MQTSIPVALLADQINNIMRPLTPGQFKIPTKIITQMCVSDVKKNFANGASPDGRKWRPLAHARPGQTGGLPLRDNGLLLASINGKATANEIIVGSGVDYASLHHFGGIIRPRKAKLLAIPLTKEAKRAGSPRRFPRALIPIIGKSGEGVLVEATATRARRGQQSQRVAQYALVKEVKVPARPFMGFSPQLLQRVERLLIETATKQLTGSK